MASLLTRLFVWLQFLLPKYVLTAIVYRISRVRTQRVKDFLITRFAALYDVDTAPLTRAVPHGFDSLNDFFTRELADDARPIDGDKRRRYYRITPEGREAVRDESRRMDHLVQAARAKRILTEDAR